MTKMPIRMKPSEEKHGDVAEGRPAAPWLLVLSVILVALTIGVYALMVFGAPRYQALYRGFGADLPTLTRIVFATYKYYGVLTLTGIIPAIFLFKRRTHPEGNRSRLFVAIVASLGLALVLLGVFATAMYMPIFALGEAVK